MKKFEYYTVRLSTLIGVEDPDTIYQRESYRLYTKDKIDKAYNDMGDKGWELVTVELIPKILKDRLIYFKREKK